MTDIDSATDELTATVAERIGTLRRAFGLSFEALAQKAGVAKGTLVQIEQNRANPSISTLCRLAVALEVSVADLVAPQPARAVTLVPRPQRLWQGPSGGEALLLAGTPGPDMLELWAWVLMPGETFASEGHGPATREIVHVTEGTLTLTIEDQTLTVPPGASAIARTDGPHAYANRGALSCRFAMTVHEPNPGA